MPMLSVTAKPRIGPVPRKNSTTPMIIDGHADREHDARDTRQRQRRPRRRQRPDKQHEVARQRYNGEHARHAVVDDHKHGDKDQPDDDRPPALPDRVGAQRRADLRVLDDLDLGRQRPGAAAPSRGEWAARHAQGGAYPRTSTSTVIHESAAANERRISACVRASSTWVSH